MLTRKTLLKSLSLTRQTALNRLTLSIGRYSIAYGSNAKRATHRTCYPTAKNDVETALQPDRLPYLALYLEDDQIVHHQILDQSEGKELVQRHHDSEHVAQKDMRRSLEVP